MPPLFARVRLRRVTPTPRAQKNGEKKLRAQLCRTSEWADPGARACVASVCAAAAQDDTSGAFATLAAVMRGDDTSASLRKSHLLMLARCWGYKSELWVRKEGRKRLPLQPEPMPPPLAPRRADARAAAAAARAAAEDAKRMPAVVEYSPSQQQQQAGYLMPCVANAIVAALNDSSGSGGEGGRYSSTLSDGHTQPMHHAGGPARRNSSSSTMPTEDAGMRAWLTVDAQLGSAAQAEAEATTRAWRERAAAHAAAAAPQHISAAQLAWGTAPPIGRWLTEQHCAVAGGGDHAAGAPSAAEAFAAVMQHGGDYDGDDPMTWGY